MLGTSSPAHFGVSLVTECYLVMCTGAQEASRSQEIKVHGDCVPGCPAFTCYLNMYALFRYKLVFPRALIL